MMSTTMTEDNLSALIEALPAARKRQIGRMLRNEQNALLRCLAEAIEQAADKGCHDLIDMIDHADEALDRLDALRLMARGLGKDRASPFETVIGDVEDLVIGVRRTLDKARATSQEART